MPVQKEQDFKAIIEQNHGSIYRICQAYLYDRSQADDLYQEILIQVWTSLSSYKGAAALSTWIYRIAVNTAITYSLKQKKNIVFPLGEHIDIPADESDKAGLQRRDARLDSLMRAIQQLDAQDRLIISLVLEGISYKDIAGITGSSTGNTGVRINRVKAKLQKLVEKTEGDEL